MRNHYTVTITNTELNKFDRTLPRACLEIMSYDQQEAAIAREFLTNAPVGAQIHAHFQGKQLLYTNRATGETLRFKNTYVKYAENRIAVKPIRHTLLGVGGFGQVKLLIDVQTGNHIVSKEFFTGDTKFKSNDRNQRLEDYYAKITQTQNLTRSFNGQISQGIVHKRRNPFKKLYHQKSTQPLDITYGNTVFSFHMTDSQIAAAEQFNANKKSVGEKRNQKFPQDVTKPMIYSEYRGNDLHDYLVKNLYEDDDEQQFPRLVQESLSIVHNHIHCQNLIHRDLKHENLLLLRNKITNKLFVHICDPDFVCQIDPITKTVFTDLNGTLNYFPPEHYLYQFCYNRTDFPEIEEYQNAIRYFVNSIYPPHTNLFNLKNVKYSPETDIFSIGKAWYLFLSAQKRKLQGKTPLSKDYLDLLSLVKLMMHYHPLARPNLILMQLAILPLAHPELNEQTLMTVLQEQQLSAISLQNLKQLSKCMLAIANTFNYKAPHTFTLFYWLYPYLERNYITIDHCERHCNQFIDFICYLHRKGSQAYYSHFDTTVQNLNQFLDFTNQFYASVELVFFEHTHAFSFLKENHLNVFWENFIENNLSELITVLTYYSHAKRKLENSNIQDNTSYIYLKTIDYIKHYFRRGDKGSLMLYLNSLNDIFLRLEAGKTIWDIILDTAHLPFENEIIIKIKVKLLFEMVDKFQYKITKSDLSKLAFIENTHTETFYFINDFIMSRRLNTENRGTRFFSSVTVPLSDYQFYYHCAVLNCIFLTAKNIGLENDSALQTDLSRLNTLLDDVKQAPDSVILSIADFRNTAIRDLLGQYFNLKVDQINSLSSVFTDITAFLSNTLHSGYETPIPAPI